MPLRTIVSTVRLWLITLRSLMVCQVVFDTNVLVSALRSKAGASAELLSRLGTDTIWQLNLSVTLVAEYAEVIHREGRALGYSWQDCEDFLNYICAAGVERQIYFGWRPFLSDPDDDSVLELAVACNANYIVTFNIRDFAGAETFGIVVLSPRDFLRKVRAGL